MSLQSPSQFIWGEGKFWSHKEVTREAQRLAKDQVGRRTTKLIFQDGAQTEKDCWKGLGPGAKVAHQGCFQGSVEALNHSIGLRVIGICEIELDTCVFGKLFEVVRGKLAALVADDGHRDAKFADPMVLDGWNDDCSGAVCKRNHFWPSGEAVNHGETIPKAFREGEGANQVDVHVCKTLC